MLLRYYITSSIVTACLFAVGQPLWALLPIVLMIVIAAGSLQSTQPSIQSLQQFTTDNIMLLSWVALMIGVIRLMYLAWYNMIISGMMVSLVTVWVYCASLVLDYQDGAIVRHQTSLLSILGVVWLILTQAIQDMSQIRVYVSLITIYLILVACIYTIYWIMSTVFDRTLPYQMRDYSVIWRTVVIPSTLLITVFVYDIVRALMLIMVMYLIYGRSLSYYEKYYMEVDNPEEVTLDLILRWYKTSTIKSVTSLTRLNELMRYIRWLSSPIQHIFRHTPDVIMVAAYVYLVIHLIWSGILVSNFLVYCICFGSYTGLYYVYKHNSIISIDNIASVVIIGYLSILALMMTVFGDDPITGSSVGIIWIVLNAVIAAQYQSLDLASYLRPHHLQRWIWANTAGAVIIIITLTQLPIDTVMIVPLMLIVAALLWFTVAQSYISLRKVHAQPATNFE